MPRVVRLPRSLADLDEVFAHLDTQGSDLAARFSRQLDAEEQRHTRSPGIGAPAGELQSGLRVFTVWNYAIFYRPIEDGIEIVRILHGARDLPRFFE